MTPKLHYGHWKITVCQCRFITCSKSPTLVGDTNNGEGLVCGITGVMWEISVLSPQFCYKLKIVLKIKCIKSRTYVVFEWVFHVYQLDQMRVVATSKHFACLSWNLVIYKIPMFSHFLLILRCSYWEKSSRSLAHLLGFFILRDSELQYLSSQVCKTSS